MSSERDLLYKILQTNIHVFDSTQKSRIIAYDKLVSLVKEHEDYISRFFEEALGKGWEEKVLEEAEKTRKGKYSVMASMLLRGEVRIPLLSGLVEVCRLQNMAEEGTARELAKALSYHMIIERYLNKIKGMGPLLSAQVVGFFGPPERWDNPGKMQAYICLVPKHYRIICAKGHKCITTSPRVVCPFKVRKGKKWVECRAEIIKCEERDGAPRREKGWKLLCNGKGKSLILGKVVPSFIKQKPDRSGYRRLFQYFREKVRETHKDWPEWRVVRTAMRKTAKVFLCNLWGAWRSLEGLPINRPIYEVEKLGHKWIPPFTDVKPDGEYDTFRLLGVEVYVPGWVVKTAPIPREWP